jgi:bifunctional UDP-N-acetylglucosamine pyrophosphorylase/glucosamine-1-phosphate N-acetyltransferase
VLILAAGRGTRMVSTRPKVLHEICGRPMIEWVIAAARDAGAERIVLVDAPEQPLAHLAGGQVRVAIQPVSDGTGGAARAGMTECGDLDHDTPVVVLSGDVPLIEADAIAALIAAHEAAGAAATVATVELADPAGYGRIVRAADGTLERIVETKRPGDASESELEIREVNGGVYVLRAGPLREALPRLTADNAQGEYYLPQALELMRADGLAVIAHRLADERLMLGVNDRVDLARVAKLAQREILERHMRAGVTIIDPDSTTIDVGVEIGPDTVIEPFSALHGTARIGADCTVCRSYIVDAVVHDGASIGPFAYLRPGADIGAGAKVGTYVEVKNSKVGAKAKIPHLSYIGDADVGERTNLGAATITANYDGHEKHRTVVGDDVRSGVDTTFVAPVTVGDGAVIGAGSVITEDVPADALAIARERQRNIEGYRERERAARDAPTR